MTRVGTALAAAVALLSVSACTGEEPAGGDPTTSAPSPRATSSPTPAAPTIPPEATEHSADGAAAFVEYWNQLLNHSMTTSSTDLLRARSTQTCKVCTSIVQLIDRVHRKGGFSESPNYRTTVTSSQLISGEFIVTADLTTDDFRFRKDSDSEVGIVKAETFQYIYHLAWNGSGWAISTLRRQELPE